MPAPTPPTDDRADAENPKTPPDELARLAADARMGIRRAAAQNPSLPQDILELLQRAGSSRDLSRAAKPDGTMSDDELAALLQLGPWARDRVAHHPNTSPATLKHLAQATEASVRRAVAQRQDADRHTLLLLLTDRNPTVCQLAREHPNAPAERVAQLNQLTQGKSLATDLLRELAQQNDATRRLVAVHPDTPDDVLQQLAKDPSWQVRAALAAQPRATSAMLAPLIQLDAPHLPQQLADHPHTPASVLTQLVHHADSAVRFAVAQHANTPSDGLALLLEDGIEPVRTAAAHHANTPADNLNTLVRAGSDPQLSTFAEPDPTLPPETLSTLSQGGPWARRLAAMHPATPTPALQHLAADADPIIRECVVRRPNAPIQPLLQLGSADDLQGHTTPDPTLSPGRLAELTDWGPWARQLAARHPNANTDLLTQLSRDTYWQTRRAVARHPNTPADTLVALCEDDSADVRWSLVQREDLPGKALYRLASDEFPAIRAAVAAHPSTPDDLRRTLAGDLDADVRAAAASA